jgi:hypothetical protein
MNLACKNSRRNRCPRWRNGDCGDARFNGPSLRAAGSCGWSSQRGLANVLVKAQRCSFARDAAAWQMILNCAVSALFVVDETRRGSP